MKKHRIIDWSPEFISWLHAVTVIGYEYHVVVLTEHAPMLELLFLEGTLPEDAIHEYIRFRIRWDELTKK